MPELPEVEIMRRGILSISGMTIQSICRERCQKKPILVQPSFPSMQRKLRNQRIETIDRWGKRLIFVMNRQLKLVYEPRMTGLVLFKDPPTNEHLRLRFKFKQASNDLLIWDRRGLSTLTLLEPAQFDMRFGNGRLGPDALDISIEQLIAALSSRSISIKIGLLDQHAVAGIGNIYASEILFLAGVDPRTPCCRVSKHRWIRIFEQMNFVLRQAIEYEGSTLNDGTFRTALSKPGNYQNHHRVYDRADKVCGVCNRSHIKRIVQAQRSTYFCPTCQRKL